jgi:hypothetical protein
MISVQNTTLDFSELSLALQTDMLSVTNSQLLLYWSQALAIGRMKSSGHSYCTWPSSILVILVVRVSDIKALHFVNGGLYLQMWRSVFPDVQNLLDTGSELWHMIHHWLQVLLWLHWLLQGLFLMHLPLLSTKWAWHSLCAHCCGQLSCIILGRFPVWISCSTSHFRWGFPQCSLSLSWKVHIDHNILLPNPFKHVSLWAGWYTWFIQGCSSSSRVCLTPLRSVCTYCLQNHQFTLWQKYSRFSTSVKMKSMYLNCFLLIYLT